jgi:hypothetical protein
MPKENHLQVYSPTNKHLGHFDGENFYTNPSTPLRVDGNEVYTLGSPTKLVGYYKGASIVSLDATILLHLR